MKPMKKKNMEKIKKRHNKIMTLAFDKDRKKYRDSYLAHR